MYAGTPYSFTQSVSIGTITPTVSGTVTSCSSAPALPVGLSINNTTCALTGTPTNLQGSTSYTITASNSTGSTNVSISIRVNAAPPSKFVFVSTNAYNGDLKGGGGGSNGKTGADNICNGDGAKPNASTYKALISVTGLRTASPALDWVLVASTSYRRADTTLVFTTNASAIFTFGSLSAPFSSAALKEYWTGIDNVTPWTNGSDCRNFEDSNSSSFGAIGLSNQTNYDSISNPTTRACNSTKYLLCVEQ